MRWLLNVFAAFGAVVLMVASVGAVILLSLLAAEWLS